MPYVCSFEASDYVIISIEKVQFDEVRFLPDSVTGSVIQSLEKLDVVEMLTVYLNHKNS